MAQLVIRNVENLDGRKNSIIVESGIITEILPEGAATVEGDRIIEGKDHMAIPGLCNLHTHAAMTLLRGAGEDLELNEWLRDRIWPLEARLTKEHIRAGVELAMLEMVKTGTTLFNDMYFMQDHVAKTVHDFGMRAVLCEGFLDLGSEEKREENIKRSNFVLDEIDRLGSDLVKGALGPHAVYTVSDEGLHWCKEEARSRGLKVHMHLSETRGEVEEIISRRGFGPVDHLDDINMLDSELIAAHCVFLTDREKDLLAVNGVNISHQPASNMKLSVGGIMDLPGLLGRGSKVGLGTDGAASNNSLDMFQTMKLAALLAKHSAGASSISSRRIIDCATSSGYGALGIHGGTLKEGYLADIVLLDTTHPSMVPTTDRYSNIVYSTTGSAVDHNIINGRVVLENGRVRNEGEILARARSAAFDLFSKDQMAS